MVKFHTKLIVSKNNGGFITEEPFVVEHPEIGCLTIPIGFSFDGNSLPRLAWVISVPSDYLESGCVHDYLYRNGAVLGIRRRTVDKVYRDFLDYQGMNKVRRWTRWLGVRAFGWGPYKEVRDGGQETDKG